MKSIREGIQVMGSRLSLIKLKVEDEAVVIGTCYHGVIGTISKVNRSGYSFRVDGIEEEYDFPFEQVMKRSDHIWYKAKTASSV